MDGVVDCESLCLSLLFVSWRFQVDSRNNSHTHNRTSRFSYIDVSPGVRLIGGVAAYRCGRVQSQPRANYCTSCTECVSFYPIKNPLKFFCNFYHYYLDHVSVTIVAPVGGNKRGRRDNASANITGYIRQPAPCNHNWSQDFSTLYAFARRHANISRFLWPSVDAFLCDSSYIEARRGWRCSRSSSCCPHDPEDVWSLLRVIRPKSELRANLSTSMDDSWGCLSLGIWWLPD